MVGNLRWPLMIKLDEAEFGPTEYLAMLRLMGRLAERFVFPGWVYPARGLNHRS